MINLATALASAETSDFGRVASPAGPDARSALTRHASLTTSSRRRPRVLERRHSEDRAAGQRGSRYVPAGPARLHLAGLLDSYRISLATAAVLAQVGPATLSALHYPQHPRYSDLVHACTASAVLDLRVQLDRIPDAALLTSVGTGRRLEGLAVLGWSWAELDAKLGLPAHTLAFRRSRRRVSAAYARQVRDLYDRLSMRLGPSAHARNRARAKGWIPPLAWDEDDIDDPRTVPPAAATLDRGWTARPDVGGQVEVDEVAVWRAVHGDPPALLSRSERVAAAIRMATAGRPDAHIAGHLGVSVRTVERWREEVRFPAPWRFECGRPGPWQGSR